MPFHFDLVFREVKGVGSRVIRIPDDSVQGHDNSRGAKAASNTVSMPLSDQAIIHTATHAAFPDVPAMDVDCQPFRAPQSL